MRNLIFSVLTSLSLVACSGGGSSKEEEPSQGTHGDNKEAKGSGGSTSSDDETKEMFGTGGSTGGSAAGAQPETSMGGAKEQSPNKLASLGIDPLGRGDGIDITESDYTGACYEDEEMEANRPLLPDPRFVAAEELEEGARLSSTSAEHARVAVEDARQAVDESFAASASAPVKVEFTTAGLGYVLALAFARDQTEKAYALAEALLSPEEEEEVTWQDLLDHPDVYIQEAGNTFLAEFLSVNETPFLIGIALDVLKDGMKAKILAHLKNVRDLARDFHDGASGKITVESPEPSADPLLLEAFEDAQVKYDELLAQALVDGQKALAARLFAFNEPSDLAPCDAEELRVSLRDSFCVEGIESPFTEEEQELYPGISARFDDYIEKVCLAVE